MRRINIERAGCRKGADGGKGESEKKKLAVIMNIVQESAGLSQGHYQSVHEETTALK